VDRSFPDRRKTRLHPDQPARDVAHSKLKRAKDKDFMVAGNAIERVHKNILKIRNFMIDEKHFPYAVFLQGSNFATESFEILCEDGRVVKVVHNSGMLNRIDRVTASNLGREINKNYCENITISVGGAPHPLQIASLYFRASPWEAKEMGEIMLDIAKTSLRIIGDHL
jgi:type II restriction enzyme